MQLSINLHPISNANARRVGYDKITHANFMLQIIWLLFNDSACSYVLCSSKRNQEEFLIMPIVGI